jgi:hypothetical protein
MSETPADHQHDTSTSGPAVEDDAGAALDRSASSIHEAKDAAGTVAAHEDITVRDAERAGEHSEDPDGTGGHP